MKPFVYVIIINYQGGKETIRCLKSLRQISYPNFKILVVDNASKDGSLEVIGDKFKNIEIIKNKKNLGFAQANNIGINYALARLAKYVLLLNNDTLVSKDFLNKLIEFGEKNAEVGIISPKISILEKPGELWYAGGEINWWSSKALNETKKTSPRPVETDFATGCAMLIKKQVFEKIGLFSSDYFLYYEDTDFCQRAKKAGFKIYYFPESQIWHKKTDTERPDLVYYFNRNRFLFMRKFAPGFLSLIAWGLLCLRIFRHGGKMLFLKDKKSKLIFKASFDALLGKKGRGDFR